MNSLSAKKLTIVDYFDFIRNKIDLAAEQLIINHLNDDQTQSAINSARAEFLSEIDKAEQFNLNACIKEAYEFPEENTDESQNDDDKDIDKAILFKRYCIYLTQYELKFYSIYNKECLVGILIVADEYLEQANFQDLK